MKQLVLLSFFTLTLWSCNPNPNKEARIQQLETKLEQLLERSIDLEARIQELEEINSNLEAEVSELNQN